MQVRRAVLVEVRRVEVVDVVEVGVIVLGVFFASIRLCALRGEFRLMCTVLARRSAHGTQSGASSAPSPGMSSTSSTVGSASSTWATLTVQYHPGYPERRFSKRSETAPESSTLYRRAGRQSLQE